MSALRFVILHHTLHGGEHWDLMLERDGMLATWQLLGEPTGINALPIPARRIGDHRIAFLEYEGPISGDRGRVTRYDSGFYEPESATDRAWVIVLTGRRLTGPLRLKSVSDADDRWVLEPGSKSQSESGSIDGSDVVSNRGNSGTPQESP